MSTQGFPALIGLEWNVERTPMWSNIVQQSVSGKTTSIALWSYPKYQWVLTYSYLPSKPTQTDFQNLFGFFNLRQGRFDTFLYTDADDYAVTNQVIGVADNATTEFQLVAAFGGFTQPILAPNVVTNVKVNGVLVDPGDYTITYWGNETPGKVIFDTAPVTGNITVTMSYYFPVRFDEDSMNFINFMRQMWSNKGVSFTSEK